jgi:hypothetical protein
VDRQDIQGIVLHGYRSLPFARYHLLGFGAGEPRQVLARLVNEISSSAEPRASWRLQFALTASGLGALGLSAQALAQFSREFRQGMAHPERSAALRDVGDEAPEAWEFGGPTTPPLDALCLTYAETRAQLAELSGAQERLLERFGMAVRSYDAELLEGWVSARPAPRLRRSQRVPHGEFVLGERDVVGDRQRGPFVPVKYGTRPMPDWSRRERAFDFGQSGSYLVLRKLTREAPFEPAADARFAAAHAGRALGSESSRAHRLLRRSRRLTDGLWFMALNASIRRQFEFVQQSRCNAPGPDGARDPLIGRASGRTAGESRQFRVRGGGYFFLPGIRALNYLAEPGG